MSSTARIPDEHAVNLVDPTAYADGRIHDTYAWLRANNPFGRAEVEGDEILAHGVGVLRRWKRRPQSGARAGL